MSAVAPPDPKPRKRIKDPALFARMHARGGECALCGQSWGLSIHHVLSRNAGGDDVPGNLVWLCGHGTAGCHGLIENEDRAARAILGRFLTDQRPEVVRYLFDRLGASAGRVWLQRHLLVEVSPLR